MASHMNGQRGATPNYTCRVPLQGKSYKVVAPHLQEEGGT